MGILQLVHIVFFISSLVSASHNESLLLLREYKYACQLILSDKNLFLWYIRESKNKHGQVRLIRDAFVKKVDNCCIYESCSGEERTKVMQIFALMPDHSGLEGCLEELRALFEAFPAVDPRPLPDKSNWVHVVTQDLFEPTSSQLLDFYQALCIFRSKEYAASEIQKCIRGDILMALSDCVHAEIFLDTPFKDVTSLCCQVLEEGNVTGLEEKEVLQYMELLTFISNPHNARSEKIRKLSLVSDKTLSFQIRSQWSDNDCAQVILAVCDGGRCSPMILREMDALFQERHFPLLKHLSYDQLKTILPAHDFLSEPILRSAYMRDKYSAVDSAVGDAVAEYKGVPWNLDVVDSIVSTLSSGWGSDYFRCFKLLNTFRLVCKQLYSLIDLVFVCRHHYGAKQVLIEDYNQYGPSGVIDICPWNKFLKTERDVVVTLEKILSLKAPVLGSPLARIKVKIESRSFLEDYLRCFPETSATKYAKIYLLSVRHCPAHKDLWFPLSFSDAKKGEAIIAISNEKSPEIYFAGHRLLDTLNIIDKHVFGVFPTKHVDTVMKAMRLLWNASSEKWLPLSVAHHNTFNFSPDFSKFIYCCAVKCFSKMVHADLASFATQVRAWDTLRVPFFRKDRMELFVRLTVSLSTKFPFYKLPVTSVDPYRYIKTLRSLYLDDNSFLKGIEYLLDSKLCTIENIEGHLVEAALDF